MSELFGEMLAAEKWRRKLVAAGFKVLSEPWSNDDGKQHDSAVAEAGVRNQRGQRVA
jgi:hypothetical protein